MILGSPATKRAVLLLTLVAMAALLLAGCGGDKDPFAGTYSWTGGYDAVMVIAPTQLPLALVQSTAAPSPGVAEPQAYVMTWYLGRQKPAHIVLVARGDSLYGAKDRRALRAGRFDGEMFRKDAGGLWGVFGSLTATNWHRYSEATKTPPW